MITSKKIFAILKDFGGIGIGCMLFVVLAVLKVTGVIGWSWWYIIAPLWMPLAIDIVLSLVYVVWQVYFKGEKTEKEDIEG